MKNLKELAQDALDVQSASNLSGVVKGFDRAIADLRSHIPDISTDKLNVHPICILWASKIASLTQCETGLNFTHAYDWVYDMSCT